MSHSASSHTTPFDALMEQINAFPLWVKQAVFVQLKEGLEHCISPNTLRLTQPPSTIQLWKPEPTRKAILELHEPSNTYPKAILHVLQLAQQSYNVINMALACRWTLQQVCQVLDKCIEEGLLKEPPVPVLQATIDYLCGKTLLGEYLVALAKIEQDKLNEALMTQQYISQAMDEQVMLGDVLISLGLIAPEDSESILFLKQDCCQTYQLINGLPFAATADYAYKPIHSGLPMEPATKKQTEALSVPSGSLGTLAKSALVLPPPPKV